MKVLVIGLGYYGKSLAVGLVNNGHEVICVDNKLSNIESIKEKIDTAFALDAADENALCTLPLSDIDLAIVAIGEDFGSSVRSIALLKKHGVKHIFARASDPVHKNIVEAFQIDRILTPEDDSAQNFAAQITLGTMVQTFNVANDFNVYKFRIPASVNGRTLEDLALETRFSLSVLAVVKEKESRNCVGIIRKEQALTNKPDARLRLTSGDTLILYGQEKDFIKLSKAL